MKPWDMIKNRHILLENDLNILNIEPLQFLLKKKGDALLQIRLERKLFILSTSSTFLEIFRKSY